MAQQRKRPWDRRPSDIFKRAAFNEIMIECGVAAALFVPVTIDTYVSVGALTTLAAMRQALPDHLQLVIVNLRNETRSALR